MIDNVVSFAIEKTATVESPRAFETIVYGGLAVGVLDGSAAVILSSLRGVSPTRVFQYIASAVLGRESYQGGLATALLGVLFHFLIAFSVATVFYFVSQKLPLLTRQAVACGMLYGVIVYFAMQYVVLPLSLVNKGPFSFQAMIQGMIVHALCVGLPVALIARWSASLQTKP